MGHFSFFKSPIRYNETMEMNYDKECFKKTCPKVDCRKKPCACGLRFVDIPAILGDDSPTSPVAPKNGEYANAIVRYEANNNVYLYSTEGTPVKVDNGNTYFNELLGRPKYAGVAMTSNTNIPDVPGAVAAEASLRYAADQVLQGEIDELKNNPDVVDIVDTYADLEAYDTTHLTNNDIIRVLNDETHNGYSTYYKFTKNPDTWTYIGTSSHDYTFEEFTFTMIDNTVITKNIAVQSQEE